MYVYIYKIYILKFYFLGAKTRYAQFNQQQLKSVSGPWNGPTLYTAFPRRRKLEPVLRRAGLSVRGWGRAPPSPALPRRIPGEGDTGKR